MSIGRLFGKPMLGASLDKSWVVHHAGRQKLKGRCSFSKFQNLKP